MTVPDTVSPETRSRIMSRIRSQGTKPELAVEAAVRRMTRRVVHTHRRDLPGRPDLYLPGLKLAIFVEGDFWHGWRNPDPICRCLRRGMETEKAFFWGGKIARNRERDRRSHARLRYRGIAVLRVWEHEVRDGSHVAKLRRAINGKWR